MARSGITYQEVFLAAQKLVAAGKNPTIATIRVALGTGSNSTLGAHLRAWKERQSQTQQIASKENIPEELIAVVKGLWERVTRQAEDEIQVIREEMQQTLGALKQEVQQLQQENVRWQQQFQKIKQERDAFFHEQSTLEKLLADSKIEMATLTEKRKALEQQVTEKQIRIDELHQQNKQIQVNLEHYREASLAQRTLDRQRHEQQQKQLEQTIQQMHQQLTQESQEKFMLQQRSQKNICEYEQLQTEYHKLNAQHETMTTRFSNIQNELTKSSQELKQLQKQHHALQIKWDEQHQIGIELQTKYALTVQQLEIEKLKSRDLSDQNKALASEKWMLGQEKAQLYGQLKEFHLQKKHDLVSESP